MQGQQPSAATNQEHALYHASLMIHATAEHITLPHVPLPHAWVFCCAGITSATLCVSATSSEDADDYRTHPLVSLAKNSPSFSELQLLLSGRSGFDAVEEVMSELHTLPALKTLRLRFIVSQTPKKGMWPLFFSEAMDAGELHCMVVEGSSMPALAVEVSSSNRPPQFAHLQGSIWSASICRTDPAAGAVL